MATKRDKDQAEVIDTVEGAQEAGYYGRKVDPKPNSAYTLQGGATDPIPTDPPDDVSPPAKPSSATQGDKA